MFSSKDIFFGSQASGYRVSNSLRFRSSASAYLSRTPASAGNRKTWTWSGWVKRGALSTSATLTLFTANYNTAPWFALQFVTGTPTDQIQITFTAGSAAGTYTNAVFRDPSSWYHIVLAVDTTQSTASNRLKLYVNGLAQTFSSTNYPSLNTDYQVNNNVSHIIGGNSGEYFDGYLAEVNFIDGQALTPSSFGAFDTNGVWQPAKYTGSYGTNGFYLPFTLNSASTYSGSFNGSSQYLSWTSNMSGLQFGTGDFTIEAWVNKSANGTNGYDGLMQYGAASAGADGWYFEVSSSRGIYFVINNTVVNATSAWTNDSQWHHVAVVRQSGTVTLYKDGIAQTSGALSASVPTTGTIGRIGESYNGTTNYYFNGSISNARIVKGTAVYTANFVPSSSALTAITNTQILTLQSSTIVDNSTNATSITNTGAVTVASATPFAANITSDASGSNNNWAANNINYTSSGTTYDSMIDSPTNYADGGNGRGNYATLSPIINGTTGLSNANLTQTAATEAFSTILIPTSGKWYWEQICQQTRFVGGLSSNTTVITGATTGSHVASGRYLFDVETGGAPTYSSNGGSFTTFGSTQTFSAGSVLGYAYDADNQKLWVSLNGTWLQGSPSSGTSPVMTPPSNGYFVIGSVPQTGYYDYHINFGQQPWDSRTSGPPSGFSALNTQNLPTPTIAAGNKYFDATTYQGTGSSQNITNSGSFQPDLVWIKGRSTSTQDHTLVDAVRGVYKRIRSNTTGAEVTETNFNVTAFNANGFSVADDTAGSYNVNGSVGGTYSGAAQYIGWQWNAGGNTIVGTGTGGITNVSYRANPTAGFSVVTYTGSGALGTVTHGLGATPSMIIVKQRTASTTTDWGVYHSSLSGGANNQLLLNTTAAAPGSSTFWGNAPTSSVFSVWTSSTTNASSGTYVAYCFAPVAGYSAFGSYAGNGSTDGPFIYTGFRPRWVMVKNLSGVASWLVYDTSRNTYNVADLYLLPNSSGAEGTSAYFDMLSNGFKLRTLDGGGNGSGNTYIYAAFAENPFKISRAR